MATLYYSVVASSLHDRDAVDRIVAPVEALLRAVGAERTTDPAAYPQSPYAVLVATGGTEARVLDAVAQRAAVAPWEPVVLLAHPWHNSLPASLESLARLRLDGRRGRIVQLGGSGGENSSATGQLDTMVADLAAAHELRRSRLGLVGKPSEWLVASVPDHAGVRERWGVELVEVDITDTITGHQRLEPGRSGPVAVRFGRPEDPELVAAAAVHPALVDTIELAQVDAVTVRCFDFLTDLQTSGCVALAQLNDTGTVAGCEGDVAGALAMMLVRQLLGCASWIANPASVDVEAGRLLLAHCTVAPSLVSDLELHSHFESGMGIGLRGSFAPGPVTLLRLGGHELEQHWFVDATIVAGGDSPDLCRTQVTLEVDPARLAELLERPLGNHLVLVPGNHAARLERWWSLVHG
ncbi:MAG TPA: hypothetical protein P5181_07265 [Dermatophilaceae bacterium]|nr:hypothetical protein [Dermatophilaceae bacterium]